MTPIVYILVGGLVLLPVVVISIHFAFRTYFTEKRRSLRAMLHGEDSHEEE